MEEEQKQKHIELIPIEEGHKSHRDRRGGKGRRPGRGHGREVGIFKFNK